MDVIAWIGRLAFFLLALWLALENTATVPLRLTSTLQWNDVPLLAIILACFLAGVLAGTIALMPRFIRMRRQLSRAPRAAASAPPVAEIALTRAARQAGAAGDFDLETRIRR
jgi:lipopolysaccharide assembly protein A